MSFFMFRPFVARCVSAFFFYLTVGLLRPGFLSKTISDSLRSILSPHLWSITIFYSFWVYSILNNEHVSFGKLMALFTVFTDFQYYYHCGYFVRFDWFSFCFLIIIIVTFPCHLVSLSIIISWFFIILVFLSLCLTLMKQC
jgi:hypothetical protein